MFKGERHALRRAGCSPIPRPRPQPARTAATTDHPPRAWISGRPGSWAIRNKGISAHDGIRFPTGPAARFDRAAWPCTRSKCVARCPAPANNPAREHPRVQRWRASVQREIKPHMAVEVAYNGSRGDSLERNIRQDYLPQQWFRQETTSATSTQQNLLNANVTNPFFIGNFEPLRTLNPALYNQMAPKLLLHPARPSNATGCCAPSPTCRAVMGSSPARFRMWGRTGAHSIEVSLTPTVLQTASRPASSIQGRGSGKIATVEEYEREPTIPAIDAGCAAAPGDGEFHRRTPVWHVETVSQ